MFFNSLNGKSQMNYTKAIVLLLLFWASTSEGAYLVVNDGFESGTSSWAAYGSYTIDSTVSHSGGQSVRCDNGSTPSNRGCSQLITFATPLNADFIRISGWSRAQNSQCSLWQTGPDYSIYVDIIYIDDTALRGQKANFYPGTHGWEYSEKLVELALPVKEIRVYCLHRQATGIVWFDDITIEQVYLDETGAGRGYALWTQDSMTRVFPQALHVLPVGASPEEPNASISLAGGEYESFQILVRSPSESYIDVRTSDLIGPGGAVIDADNIEWFEVGYVRVETLDAPYIIANMPYLHQLGAQPPNWWPDALLPVSQVHLSADFTQSIWITVYAEPNTPAGQYTGSIQLNPQGMDSTTVTVQAEVYNFNLPSGAGHLKNSFSLTEEYMEKVYGTPVSSIMHRAYGDYMLEHRLNPDDNRRKVLLEIDDLLHYRGLGLNSFNVQDFTQHSLWWFTEANKQATFAELDPYFQALAAEESLYDKACIYGFDEWDVSAYGSIMPEWFGIVQDQWNVPTFTTAHINQDPSDLDYYNVDWLCPITSTYNFNDAQTCRNAGFEIWSYVSLMPYPPDYANWRLDCALIEARVLMWQGYHQKFDGFLYWNVNMWERPGNPNSPIDPNAEGPLLDWNLCTCFADYDWLYGDGVLLYPGIDGPIGSIRLENVRDGLEDYEYLWLLAQATGNVEAARSLCEPVTQSLTKFGHNSKTLYGQRHIIARQLEVALHPCPLGDISGPDGVGDCLINIYDFAKLAQGWMQPTYLEVEVENRSFEIPDRPTGTGENYGDHVGWTTSNSKGYVDERDWLFKTYGFNPPDPTQPQWLTMETAGEEAYQRLDHTITTNTTYTLSLDIGMASWAASWIYSDYSVKLVSATSYDIIAQTDQSVSGLPSLDTYIPISATGMTGDISDVRVGQQLKIVLVNPGPADPGIVCWDNIRITAESSSTYNWDDLALIVQHWLKEDQP